jgi:acyl dehydratase
VTQQQEDETLITDEMRAGLNKDGPPTTLEVEKTSIRMFARAVGHTDLIFFDEAYAKSKGHRSIVAPPGYLGTPIFTPTSGGFTGPGGVSPSGRPLRALNGGTEYEYYGIDICAGDTITAVSKTVDMTERRSSMGLMLITRRETTYTNQDGQVVCRGYGTGLTY